VKNRMIWLVKVYACLMKLYPARYCNEFGEDRQEVFTLALQDAASRGKWALFRLVFCELQDYPASVIKANLREWRAMMKMSETGLLGAWPFIFLGPLMAVAPYLPRHIAEWLRFDSPLWLAIVILSLTIGILVGWRKGFPRWVYPYLVILFFVIVIPVLGKLSTLLGPNRFSPWVGLAILLLTILGFGVGALYLLSRLPTTRRIFRDVRADWTRLSFGMFVYLAFGTGFYGGDHLPPFGLGVWLPPVIVVIGAIVYLLCRSRLMRSLALLATLLTGFLGKMVFANDDRWSLLAILLVVMLIFLPALLELLPHPNIRQAD
jgi:hypothetical protein